MRIPIYKKRKVLKIVEYNSNEKFSGFEVEMRTSLAKLSVQQEELAKDVRDYLSKTMNQEVEISKMRSEIDTLFDYHTELKEDLQRSQENISKVIDDKIESLYKLAGITAFIVSTIVAMIGVAISH
jgi:K+/H+ antiporter YhaU regulatory subunit KhtT